MRLTMANVYQVLGNTLRASGGLLLLSLSTRQTDHAEVRRRNTDAYI